MTQVAITVNGVRREADVEPRTLLVYFLRETLGLTGTNVRIESNATDTVLYLVGMGLLGAWLGKRAGVSVLRQLVAAGLLHGQRGHHGGFRLARGATGRAAIIKFAGCYHGHLDAMLVAAGSGVATLGIPGSAGVTPEASAICSISGWARQFLLMWAMARRTMS